MTATFLDRTSGTSPTDGAADSSSATSHVVGLACKRCHAPQPLGASFVCPACFGPLEVVYDYDVIRGRISRDVIAARPAGIWRYAELLPTSGVPSRGLAVGSTPLLAAPRLGESIGIGNLRLKDDTRNPTLSFKDRVVAVAAARAVEFGFDTLACASTGNLAGATAAAASALGLRSFVFVPHDLEPAKIDHALAFGATVVPVKGTYDDINRLCLEIADEEGWAFVNVNMRPFYSEGSKTLGFEIAEQLGWRLPDVIVSPIASGSLFTKVARAFRELVEVGLVEPKAVRFVGGQASGCAPVGNAFASGAAEISPVRVPETIVRSLSIGSPADGLYALELARGSGGSVESVSDASTAAAIRALGRLEGVFAETAGGVTVAAAEAARRAGVIRDGDEVVCLITGNGVKTPDARRFGLAADGVGAAEGAAGGSAGGGAEAGDGGDPGLARAIAPTYRDFEALKGERGIA